MSADKKKIELNERGGTNQRTLFLVGISVHLIVISFVCLPLYEITVFVVIVVGSLKLKIQCVCNNDVILVSIFRTNSDDKLSFSYTKNCSRETEAKIRKIFLFFRITFLNLKPRAKTLERKVERKSKKFSLKKKSP